MCVCVWVFCVFVYCVQLTSLFIISCCRHMHAHTIIYNLYVYICIHKATHSVIGGWGGEGEAKQKQSNIKNKQASKQTRQASKQASKQTNRQPTNQPINQSINRSTNQPTNQTNKQLTNQSMNQSNTQPTNQPNKNKNEQKQTVNSFECSCPTRTLTPPFGADRRSQECASINRIYGFYDECKRRYSIRPPLFV